jgi:maltooligosyltrehalose trehalohydrolase
LQQDGHKELLSFYKTIIALRKKYAPLHNTNREQLTVSSDPQTNCLVLRRWEEEVQVLCLMNFSSKTHGLTIPDDKPSWKKILDSADPQWKGPKAAPVSVDALQKMEIQPQSILIYTNKYA